MTTTAEYLYRLLPAVYRLRDVDEGLPLQGLIEVIAEQVDVTVQDLNQLYKNWFIETCDDWVVPYIGDLVGFRREGLNERTDGTAVSGQRDTFLFPRREVANTIRFRRRKGTLAVLEELAADAGGWPARAVEFGKLLVQTQSVRYPFAAPGQTVRLTERTERLTTFNAKVPDSLPPLPLDWDTRDLLGRINGPFDSAAHTVDVRHLDPNDTAGQFHPHHVGLFVWRHRTYGVANSKAKCLDDDDEWRMFAISPAGFATPLYIRPESEESPTTIASESNVPAPLTRRALTATENHLSVASGRYYGRDKSLAIWIEGKDQSLRFVERSRILPADLSWFFEQKHLKVPDQLRAALENNKRPPYRVAVDPERGLILAPAERLRVSYHYGFSADMGGGSYHRRLELPAPTAKVVRIGESRTLEDVLGTADYFKIVEPKKDEKYRLEVDDLILEFTDNWVYSLPITTILLGPGQSLQLRAANGRRPVITMQQSACQGGLRVEMGLNSRLVLDGLFLVGNGIEISGSSDTTPLPQAKHRPRVEVRHCTLVPGGCAPGCCGSFQRSLELNIPGGCVTIESSIIGQISENKRGAQIDESAYRPEAPPDKIQLSTELRIADSIVDATAGSQEGIRGSHELNLSAERSTFFGRVEVRSIQKAQDCLFRDSVCVQRREEGGLRFCYLPPESVTPRRYYCQPDLAIQRQPQNESTSSCGTSKDPAEEVCGNDLAEVPSTPHREIYPRFVSTRFGDPGYAQLAAECPPEISRGSEDESELGVFHDLYQPQRYANLLARLQEFTPITMEAAIFFAT
jgi:hypothetical protein